MSKQDERSARRIQLAEDLFKTVDDLIVREVDYWTRDDVARSLGAS